MGWLLKAVITLVVGILSASLAIVFQNDIASALGRAPISAETTVGAWYPMFDDTNKNKIFNKSDDKAANEYSDEEDVKFIRINIKNNSGKKLDDVYITCDSSWVTFKGLTIRQNGENLQRDVIMTPSRRMNLGPMEPATVLTAYIWSNRTFSYPFNFGDISIISVDGKMPNYIYRLKLGNSGDLEGGFFGYLPWIIVGLVFLLVFTLIWAAIKQWTFIRALLKSEDYYLDQRQIFDEAPDSFVMPKQIPS